MEAFANQVSGKKPRFKVLGIHQVGNSASVYYQYQEKWFAASIDRIELIRFNSGKWFCPDEEQFLKGE